MHRPGSPGFNSGGPACFRNQPAVLEFNFDGEPVGNSPHLHDARFRFRLGAMNGQKGRDLRGSHPQLQLVVGVASPASVEDRKTEDAKNDGDVEQPEIATEPRSWLLERFSLRISIQRASHGSILSATLDIERHVLPALQILPNTAW